MAYVYPISNVPLCKSIDEAMQLPTTFGHFSKHIANGMNAIISTTKLHNKTVVIKVLKKSYPEDHLAVREIQMEAKVLKCFDHPNIIDIIGCGKCNNLHFLALEYLEGGTLQKLLVSNETPAQKLIRMFSMKPLISLERVLRIGLDFANAMKYLHYDVDPNAFFIHRGVDIEYYIFIEIILTFPKLFKYFIDLSYKK